MSSKIPRNWNYKSLRKDLPSNLHGSCESSMKFGSAHVLGPLRKIASIKIDGMFGVKRPPFPPRCMGKAAFGHDDSFIHT